MKNFIKTKIQYDKELHYDLTKKFFLKDAADKKGYYNVKDIKQVKNDIHLRRMWKVYTSILDEVLQNDSKITSVIDVGCGMGNFTLELVNQKQFKKIAGIDFLRNTMDIACEKKSFFQKVCFVQGDLLFMPFKDRCFDLTVCLNTLHHIHIDDFGRAIQRLAQVTDKYLILEIRNKKNILDAWYSKIILPKYYEKLPLFKSSIQEVNDLMKKCDFQLVRVRGGKIFSWACRRLVMVYKRV